MYNKMENILFCQKQQEFAALRDKVNQFRALYSGSNIVQDDIFQVIENYTSREDRPFELLRIPVEDHELCACTFLRSGRIFVMINSNLILAKQIFAAAHELYHIYRYLEGDNFNLSRHGSILMSSSMDEEAVNEEDMEANAFAGLFLAPAGQLHEQIDIYRIPVDDISLSDILKLVDIFAIPYKAMVLRLYEEKIIRENKVCQFFEVKEEEFLRQIDITGRAKRWYSVPTDCIKFGSLYENFEVNQEYEALDEHRISTDRQRISELWQKLKKS